MDIKVLKERHDELVRVNYQWEKQYFDLDTEFKEYRKGAKKAQDNLTTHLYSIKQRLADKEEELERIKGNLKHGTNTSVSPSIEHEMRDLEQLTRRLEHQLDEAHAHIQRQRDHIKQLEEEVQHLKQQQQQGGYGTESTRQLKEENSYLRQQLMQYEKDFRAERDDKEALKEKVEEMQIKMDANIAALKLKLDSCQRDLEQCRKDRDTFKAQANLKSVREEAKAQKYHHEQGYVARSVKKDDYQESNSEPTSLANTNGKANGRKSPKVSSSSDDLWSIIDKQSGHQHNGDLPPPFHGKGKYKCDKCYRRFEYKEELNQHKIRCLI